MKKIFTALLTLSLMISAASCGSIKSGGDKVKSKEKATVATSAPEETTEATEPTEGETMWEEETEPVGDTDITGKTLADVTYYNYTPMVKRDFGIDISEEDGWEIIFTDWDVTPYMDNGVMIHTNYKGTDIKALMKTYYDRCAEVAADGLWDYNYIWYTHDDPLNPEEKKTFDQCFDEWNGDDAEIESRCDVRWAYTYNDRVIFFWIERTSETSVDIKIEFKSEDMD